MYVLTIRDGLHTRHIGPYETPKQAADQLEHWLSPLGDRPHWQIHQLEAPHSQDLRSAGSRETKAPCAAL